jgi:hypothetical protein
MPLVGRIVISNGLASVCDTFRRTCVGQAHDRDNDTSAYLVSRRVAVYGSTPNMENGELEPSRHQAFMYEGSLVLNNGNAFTVSLLMDNVFSCQVTSDHSAFSL